MPNCTAFTLKDTAGAHNGGLVYQCAIDTSTFPDALCNDGTPGVFQFQPAAKPGTKWVIWLDGGAQCQSPASCTARARNARTHHLVTSNGDTPRAGQGLLSHDPKVNPTLAGANTVQVRYCSSDAWSGGYRAPASAGPWNPYDVTTWNFLGRAIAKGAVGTLVTLGVGFDQASEVVLGGSSAGGYGITVTANDLIPLLPQAARVLLVQDVAFTLSLGRFDPSAPSPYVHPGPTSPFRRLIMQGRALWHGRGDRPCDAAASTEQEHLDCMDTVAVLQRGWIAAPTFVANALLDTPTVQAQICPPLGRCPPPHDPGSPQGVYATYVAQQFRRALSENGARSLPYTAFAPDAYVHPLLDVDSAFTTAYAFGHARVSARDAFATWYANPATPGKPMLGTGPGVQ